MRNIKLNYRRLNDAPYSLENLFQPESYDWPGDWEGRALLAFLCHYEIDKSEIPHLHRFFHAIGEKTNEYSYFGKPFDQLTVDEQQLSGHNWYLRGLLKYWKLFNSETAMSYAKSTVENLYLPSINWYSHYPLARDYTHGDVSGTVTSIRDGWKLSSDIGCAFMCVDGLAHYYQATRDKRVKDFLDRVIELFISVDLLKYKLQTHTTLTCLRGILTLYQATGDARYLGIVKDKFSFYQENGMTLTYENYNWFGRQDSWTEPCAVVDSLIIAIKLYELTECEEYKALARRIWFNGLQFCQRENGGAGPNTCVTIDSPVLKISMYEAPFCCTMRYAEGLLEFHKNRHLFAWNKNATPTRDEIGRCFVDDMLLVRHNGELVPIFSCNTLKEEDALKTELGVLN